MNFKDTMKQTIKQPTFWVNVTGLLAAMGNLFHTPFHLDPTKLAAAIAWFLAIFNIGAHGARTINGKSQN